jgi:hypothetical protein
VGLSFFGSCDHVPARLISSVAHTHAPLHMSILVLLSAAMEIRAWALKTLDGTARGCVRRSRNIPLEQLVGLESRLRRNGVLSRAESVAAILAAVAGVPNPDPTKFAAVTAAFRA